MDKLSQPLIVALMTQHEVKSNMRVLEVGTGSGYQTLVLSKIAKFVYTIERYKTCIKKPNMLKIIKAKNVLGIVMVGLVGLNKHLLIELLLLPVHLKYQII